ncbi:histidine phosphatase family protein [Rhodohalobacter sp. SW132]|uniref:SixA phosphatase family protein n=1 Tax=Rhodohalobacter sp. SW132 TaxID=2293433 RepID=UPI000E232589|nr:histidine phosphatase family protein [Rhodohalobacter sp. SW132]REL24768.1 histidine phosphatase family protein [Rhodohalobacter sp. SW132]
MSEKKTILFMRHAKSSWADSAQKDFDRPLNKRGKRDAPAMGRYLKEQGVVPDYIVSSAAQRARETVLLLAYAQGQGENIISWNEDLYYEGADAYLQAVRRAPESALTILVAGHNPSVERVVARLVDKRTNLTFTTANIACFETSAERWKDTGPENCTFKWLVTPNDIE